MTDPAIVPAEPNRRALILPGGGMRVAYQAGAVQALHEAGLRFSFADGTSGGTMNLAALLSGVAPAELAARWRSLDPMAFVSLQPVHAYARLPKLSALGDFDGLRRRVFPHLGIDLARINAAAGIDATFNVCRFDDKAVVPVPHGELELPLLLAGVSLPLLTPPVEHGGRTWTDAVWIRDSNILETVKKGANEIWIVWCIGNTPRYLPGFLNQYVHMIEMSAVGALNAELDTIASLNTAIGGGERPYGHDRPIAVHVVKPKYPIPLDPDYLAGKVTGGALVDQGFADASSYLRGRRGGGVPLTAEATGMRPPGAGLSFRETMRGHIAFGHSDPDAAARSHAALPIAINATINIRDLDAFVSEPEHRGEMAAHLYCPRLGGRLPATRTNFQLFSPTGDAARTEMVYEMGFRHDGRQYFFSGRKNVQRGSPLRLWSDTTTLCVRVHEGEDRGGAVMATGVLRLGVFDLLSLLATLHSRDVTGLWARLGPPARFAGFFAGQLWATYGPRGRRG